MPDTGYMNGRVTKALLYADGKFVEHLYTGMGHHMVSVKKGIVTRGETDNFGGLNSLGKNLSTS